MKYLSHSEALERLTHAEGQFLSVYLPYGIYGIDDEKSRIHRKNVLSEAATTLKETGSSYWITQLKSIDTMSSEKSDHDDHGAYTRVYFVGEEDVFWTTLPGTIKAHFMFGNYADIEPLIYMEWANIPFEIIKLDLEKPEIYRGFGTDVYKVKIEVGQPTADDFGEQFADYSLKSIVERADRHANESSPLDKTKDSSRTAGKYYGFTSRKKDQKENDVDYWLKVVGPVIMLNLDKTIKKRFVAGSNYVAQKFTQVFRPPGVETGSIFELGSGSIEDITKTIQERLVDERLKKTLSESRSNELAVDHRDIERLLDSGQVQELIVEQKDDFIKENVKSRSYQDAGERAKLIWKANSRHAKVCYTGHHIDSSSGIAAVIR